MNCNCLKIYGIIILLFLFTHHSFAQAGQAIQDSGTIPVQDTAQVDTSEYFGDTAVTKNVFANSGDSVTQWKQHQEFGYMAYIDSLLRKRQGRLRIDTISIARDHGNLKRGTASSEESEPSFLNSAPVKYFFWIIAIFFILFILYRALFKGGLFERNAREGEDGIAPPEPEKLNEYEAYNQLIHTAETGNDYNLATRYLYLQALKKLSDQEAILFSPDKTNGAYLEELSGKTYQSEFSYLTMNYEYIWYGKFAISRDRYIQLKNNFYSFIKKI